MKPGPTNVIKIYLISLITATHNAFVQIIRKREEQVYTFTIVFNIEEGGDLTFPEKQYESVFIEVDNTIFNLNRNIIIREIYNPTSTKLKCFNSNLVKLLNAIKKRK